MLLSDDLKAGLNIALNEATLLGAELDTQRRRAALTFSVLSLMPSGEPPADPRIQIFLTPVGRAEGSLRYERWDVPEAEAEPFEPIELLELVETFKSPVYGWKFFDLPENERLWRKRLSFSFLSGENGRSHSITLFQASEDSSLPQSHKNRILEFSIWFDALSIKCPDGHKLSLEECIAAGRRWWDAMYAGDPATQQSGIFPQPD